MARSLGLAAYMAIAWRSDPAQPWAAPALRGTGEVIWGHATSTERMRLLCHLYHRLAAQRPGLQLWLTVAETLPPQAVPPDVVVAALPAESQRDCRRFLDHVRPALCLWTGGYLRPALIAEASLRAMPLFLLDAEENGLDESRFRWLPDVPRATLRHFDRAFAGSANAAQRLLKQGLPPDTVAVTGPLDLSGPLPPSNDAQRDALARDLAGRAVWMAADLVAEEIVPVLDAHRLSLRGAHRQLLILIPADPAAGPAIAEILAADGWRFVCRSQDEMPGEATQVLLADKPGEAGLWHRLAPVCFMGSSLLPGHGGRDPFVAAALGQAILYGPQVGRYLSAYTRLATAGAARMVKDATTLAAALQRLGAPDQAAAMAHAAWEVVTRGAEETDRLLDLLHDTLDLAEVV